MKNNQCFSMRRRGCLFPSSDHIRPHLQRKHIMRWTCRWSLWEAPPWATERGLLLIIRLKFMMRLLNMNIFTFTHSSTYLCWWKSFRTHLNGCKASWCRAAVFFGLNPASSDYFCLFASQVGLFPHYSLNQSPTHQLGCYLVSTSDWLAAGISHIDGGSSGLPGFSF